MYRKGFALQPTVQGFPFTFAGNAIHARQNLNGVIKPQGTAVVNGFFIQFNGITRSGVLI